jgi:hypothetical protein
MPIGYQLPGIGVGNTFDVTIPIGYDTDLAPNAGKQQILAEDGTVVVLDYFANPVYSGQIICPFLTDTQRLAIETFYTTNRILVWQFQHPGDGYSYSLYFANAPHTKRFLADGNKIFTVELSVIGYRN